MAQLDQLLSTIENVHAAGLDDTHWPQALAAMADSVGGNAASIEVCDQQSLAHMEMYSYGLPGGEEIAFREDFAEINIRFPFVARQGLNELSWDYMILDEAAMRRAPFYTEVMPHFDIRYFVAGIVFKNGSEFASAAVHRSPRMGHIQKDGIALMRTLLPHVRQAFDVSRRLRGAQAPRRDFERALDALDDGVALIRADGTILFANAALAAMARRADGIVLRKGAIVFADTDVQARYARAVAAVLRLRDSDPAPSSAADIPVSRPHGAPPYLVSVRPLFEKVGIASGSAVALVFVRDPLQSRATAAGVLCERFGLTPAEIALAQAIQSGVAPPNYAHQQGLSLNTVYTHLRRLREKTSGRQMSELIHKLDGL